MTPIRTDGDFAKVATNYRNAKAALDAAKQAEADAREALLEASGDDGAAGFGVSVTKQHRKGSIDYRRMCDDLLPGVDVEEYRKDDSDIFVVKVSKEF